MLTISDEPLLRELWTDPTTGLTCLIKQVPQLRHLCGYVAVPKSHPAYGKDDSELNFSVHGGITYACECDGDPVNGICHPSDDGDHVWWLGFDCAHSGDLIPGIDQYIRRASNYETYKDRNYVKAECESLAKQLIAMASV